MDMIGKIRRLSRRGKKSEREISRMTGLSRNTIAKWLDGEGAVDLSVTKSHSRPHVSDDNPYSESQFKTLKYRPEFPARFDSIEQARAFCQIFFAWYNDEHRHSGIGYMTPAAMHSGQAQQCYAARQRVLDGAFELNPARFTQRHPVPPALPTAAGINWPKPGANETIDPSISTLNSIQAVSHCA